MIVKDQYSDITQQAWTFISGGDKFGGAWEDGSLNVTTWVPSLNKHYTLEFRCRSYRQAVRQLRRWMRGQGVTARRIK